MRWLSGFHIKHWGRIMGRIVVRLLGVCIAIVLGGCATPRFYSLWPISNDKGRLTETILGLGPIAQSSMLACVYDALRQGVPMNQAIKLCETQLLDDAGKGFGHDVPEGFGGRVDAFDPSTIVDGCAQTDIRYSQVPSPPSPLIPYSNVDPTTRKTYYGVEVEDYGYYTYGGEGSGKKFNADGTPWTDGQPYVYRGLTQDQVEQEKRELVELAETAKRAMEEAEKIFQADPTNKEKEAARDKKTLEYLDASKKATKDPNFIPFGQSQPGPQDSICQQTLASARELLRECNRNGWKSTACQRLHAKMNGCPDPTLILVDPEAGYTCGVVVEPRLVIEAWRARCEQVTTPGPDGGTPCTLSDPSANGLIFRNRTWDLCNNPIAYVDLEGSACFDQTATDSFGQPNVKSIVTFGFKKFGGPIFVVPSNTPPPRTKGPDPRPGPHQ
jgi:hypothetical protein